MQFHEPRYASLAGASALGKIGPRIAMISTHGYVARCPPLGAADTGGQVVYVLELSKKLGELGYEVDIWTRLFDAQPEVEPVSDRVRIIRVPCGGPSFIPKERLYESLYEWVERALRIARKHALRYELINSHYWDAGVAGLFLTSELGAFHAHTPHSLGVWKQRQMEVDRPGQSAELELEFNFEARIAHERRIHQAADLVVATTPVQLDLMATEYGIEPAKCRMIPPGYDDRRFFPVSEATRQAIRARLKLTGNVIFAVGRLATNKGYDLLLRAFRVVAARDSDAQLVLALGGANLDAGETRLLRELHELARQEQLTSRVQFLGFIPEEDLADYYRAADEFVLSSRYEPFGMTAVEAMACGTPSVITVHGGLHRALTFGRHALFADPFDAEDLGITMIKPLRMARLKARLGRMGAHKARGLFSWTGIAHQLLSAIEPRPPPAFAMDDREMEWDEPWNDGD